MTEGRRRQIIKTADPRPEAPVEESAPEFESPADFDYPKENLLEKRVYLTWPMVALGLVAVMITSFLVTFVVVRWPESDLELGPNPTIEAMKKDLAGEHLPVREASLPDVLDAGTPEADVEPGPQGHRTAIVTPESVSERAFARPQTQGAGRPVAIVSPPTQRRSDLENQAAALKTPADIPGERGRETLATPLTAEHPLADLSPADFKAAFDPPEVDVPNQHLMFRRYAKGTETPVSANNINPLGISVVGDGLPERAFQKQNPQKAGNPVASVAPSRFTEAFDMKGADIPKQKNMDRPIAKTAGYPTPPEGVDPLTIPVTGTGLPQRQAHLNRPLDTGHPVADLKPAGAVAISVDGPAEVPGQKLMMRRYAKVTGDPAYDAGSNPLTAPVTGAGLPEREANLRRALGIGTPVSDLDPASHSGGLETPPTASIPKERVMQRRYAKATTNPTRGDVVIQPPVTTTPALAGEADKPWRRYAAAVPDNIAGKGRIVIIIDDMGNNPTMARHLAELKGPLNFAFLPYAPGLAAQTKMMRDHGHELLVHLPMEPEGDERPGPHALLTEETNQKITSEIDWNLSQFDGFVGVNNHMGSLFTEDTEKMRLVMQALKDRGLLFLDSLTSPHSMGRKLASDYGLPWASRDVFLDNVPEEGAILQQLAKVERLAGERGVAIAIGHPNVATLHALEEWIPTLEAKGLVLVPLSSVVHFKGQRKLAARGGSAGNQ